MNKLVKTVLDTKNFLRKILFVQLLNVVWFFLVISGKTSKKDKYISYDEGYLVNSRLAESKKLN